MKVPFLLRVLTVLLGFASLLKAAPFIPFTFEVPASTVPELEREVTALVRHPDGRTLRLPAYAEQKEGLFTVRAMPYSKGEYTFVGAVERTDQGDNTLAARLRGPAQVSAEEPLALPRVIVDPARPYRFSTTAGTPFYPLGMNLAWPLAERLPFYRDSFSALQRNGMNWTRIWFADWGGLNLDWLPQDLAPSPAPGGIDTRVAANWDAIIEDATEKGIYIQMVLQHHGQYSASIDSNWAYNPWNAALPGGFLKSPVDFFTDEKARRLTRQKYRYIVARWGWSPSVMAWELFNEVYQVDAYAQGNVKVVADWHNEMADHLRAIDPYQHLVTTSLNDIRSPIWEKMDFLQPHLYAANVVDSVRTFYPSLTGITRPIFYGEVGDDAVLLPRPLLDSGAPIIASMWSSIMGEAEYPAQPWYPERLLTKERLADLAALSRFITTNKLAERAGLSAFQPAIESTDKVSLVVPAGQWWSRRPSAVVNIPADGRVLPDLTLVPRAFVGSPDAIADGYAGRALISADFPKITTARVRLNDVGGYGAKLRVSIDGRVAIDCSFDESMKGLQGRPQRPAEIAFVVPAGRHEIVVENPGGPDWFDFHSLDLGIETPALAAAGRRSDDFAMVWVWHRRGLFEKAEPAKAKVLIETLAAGEWTISWWDTSTGAITSTQVVTHNGGTLSLETPPIAKDAAVALERRR